MSTEPMKELEQRCAELETANARLARRLAKSERHLQQAHAELEAFGRVVGQDYRTPLFHLLGFTAELERLHRELFEHWDDPQAAERPRLQRQVDEAFRYANAASAKIVSRIEATLWVLRAALGKPKLQTVDLDALVREVALPLQRVLRDREGLFLIGPMPRYVTDPLVLGEMLRHLLHNAVNYLREDVPFHVEVSCEQHEESLLLSIHDNGRGIPMREQAAVFQLFQRALPLDRAGEGLGLSHVRSLARKLGGLVQLRSEPGVGSTFFVELPLTPIATATHELAAATDA